MTNELVVAEQIRPGLVPTGFAEKVLERSATIDDPMMLWDGSTTLAGLAQKWNGHGREKNEIKTAQMFVEVELGQRLGPRPGAGAHNRLNWHANLDIPADVVSYLRRYFDHRDLLIEAIREGALSRRSLLLLVDRNEAAGRDEPAIEDLAIRPGDFRSVLGDVEPGSVALVLTDPPYPEEYIDLWSDLAKFSASALVDGGSLIAYCGQSILPAAANRLDEHLRYWWTLALVHSSGSQMLPGKFVSVGWKPLLWYVNGGRRDKSMVPDRIAGSAPRKTTPTGDDGTWAQGVDELESVISALTGPGELIVDPMAGSGSVGIAALRFGRRFLGATL